MLPGAPDRHLYGDHPERWLGQSAPLKGFGLLWGFSMLDPRMKIMKPESPAIQTDSAISGDLALKVALAIPNAQT